jgi:transaldolase
MQISLDTADLDEVRSGAELGVLRKVTTNPSHMAKAGVRDPRRHVQEICHIADVPISAEVTATASEEMISQARDIATWSPNVVVKLPTTPDGLRAMHSFTSETHTADCAGCPYRTGCAIRERFAATEALTRTVPVNATVIFSVGQAVAASSAGASYVSPFIGRLDAVGQDGMHLLSDIAEIFRRHDVPTRIIAAALRHPIHVSESFKAGAHICTMSYAVLDQLLHHPLTDAAVEGFMADWAALQASLATSTVPPDEKPARSPV